MSFIHSQALWLGLTLPAIIFLYILRPRRRRRRVASTFLWQQVSSELEASRPWQRLRPNLLMWLQLLVAALLVLAAAGPVARLAGQTKNTIVLLDTSASMGATDVAPDRLAWACREIEDLAAGLRGGARLTVIAFDRQPRVIVRDATGAAEVRQALAGLRPSASTADLGPALSLAQALARQMSGPRLLLISDGGLDFAGELPADLEFLPVGKSSANVALAGVTLRPLGDHQAAQVTVVNNGDEAAGGSVNLSVNGRPAGAKKWDLPPGASAHLLWPELPAGSIVAAELEVDDPGRDYLKLDNRAWAVPESNRTAKALLVTGGNIFLERALSLIPGLEVYRVGPEEYLRLKSTSYPYELTVMDGYHDGALPPGAVWLINPPAGSEFGGITAGPPIKPGEIAADPASPVLRYVDLKEVRLAQACQLSLTSGWTADITAEGLPLLARGEIKGKRLAVLAFDLKLSDLPLRPAFPILVQNLVYWLLPPALQVPGAAQAGREVTIAALPLAENITIEGPDGSQTQLAPPFPPAPFVPAEPGLYRIVQRWQNPERPGDIVEVKQTFAVNGYHPGEASLSPKVPSGKGTGEKPGAPLQQVPATTRPVPLTTGLALAALLVALGEWGVASRGR